MARHATSMVSSILDVMNRLRGLRTTKTEFIKGVEFIKDVVLGNTLLPMLKSLLKCRSKYKSPKDKELNHIKINKYLINLREYVSLDARDGYSILEEINRGLIHIHENLDPFLTLLDERLADEIDPDNMKVFTGVAVRYCLDIHVICNYCLDLLQVAVCNDKEVPEKIYANVEQNAKEFGAIWRIYGFSFKQKVEELKDLVDGSIEINKDTSTYVTDLAIRDNGDYIDMPPSLSKGFIGNPIYHYRLFLADRENKQINLMKAEKSRLEYKLIELKQEQETGNDDGKLTKIIDRITVDIDKLREDIENRLNV